MQLSGFHDVLMFFLVLAHNFCSGKSSAQMQEYLRTVPENDLKKRLED